MSHPTTPSKKGEEINEVVRELNSRWSLHIPVKSELWSPSKVLNRNAMEEKIFSTIRFLYWKSLPSLQLALDKFNEHAKYAASQWRFKPRADIETLPARHPSESQLRRDSFQYGQDVPPSEQIELKKALLRFLEEMKSDLSPEKLSRLSSMEPEPVRLPVQSYTNRKLFERTQPLGHRQSRLDIKLPSSDDFSLSPATADVYTTIEMTDESNGSFCMPHKVVGKGQSATSISEQTASDEVFATPPTSPPSLPTHSTRRNRSGGSMFTQKSDLVQLPGRTVESKKRSTPEYSQTSFPGKAARETKSHESPRLHAVSYMEPQRDLTRSFESVYSQPFSVVTASTARTTPNTSFYGAKSFELPSDENDLASLQLRRGATASEYIEPMKSRIETVEDPMDIDADIDLVTTTKSRFDQEYTLLPRVLQKEPDMTIEDQGSYPISESIFAGLDSQPDQFVDQVTDLGKNSFVGKKRNARLVDQSPFTPLSSPVNISSLRILYEVSRVAQHYSIPISDLSNDLQGRSNIEYEELWSLLSKRWANTEKPMPEQSSSAAWKRTEGKFEGVTLSGELSFSKKSEDSVFDLRLRPLKLEQSYRLSRAFGGDRFFVLGIPGLDQKELPSHLQRDAESFRAEVISWIANTEHHFLGRSWRAFYVKPQQFGQRFRRAIAPGEAKYRIFFFAVNGEDFPALNDAAKNAPGSQMFRQPMSIEALLDWFMPAKSNLNQPALKLFARLQLAVSTTDATIVFEPRQIVRTHDAYANSPGERLLATNRYKRRGSAKVKNESAIMNDGCARISRAAAVAVANKLNLNGNVPSAFQGRIGGAKGVWMVDARGERSPRYQDEVWIEITDSQLKFEGHEVDKKKPDHNRVTFEVNKYSKTLTSRGLNFQLIPILVDRGVPRHVFERLFREDLTTKVGALESAMDDGLRLRQWNQENNSVKIDRLRTRTIDTVGGVPDPEPEKINWFAEHGFEPAECSFLKDICYKAANVYCQRLEKKMKIGIGRSTIALMIADPLGILEEGEVHLGFSSCFRDERSRFQDTFLNGIDVLVARNPAHLPSDIQKVHAAFKPELSIYKDVIIFSSKGKCSLAEMLSGGDFDGDQAWICWEPDIVNFFTNEAEGEYIPKDLDYYGISKDNTKVSDMIHQPDFTNQFLHKGFDFNIQSPLLGVCSYYHEAYCYHQGSINSPKAKDLALLLGKLVDSAKGGFIFTGTDWRSFKEKCHTPRQLDKPAYKVDGISTSHVIDQLVLEIGKGIRQRALGKFNDRFKDARKYDEDLVALWKEEDEYAKKDKELGLILKDLVAQLQKIHDFWASNVTEPNPNDDGSRRDKPGLSFTAVAQNARSRFLAAKPLETSTHMLAQRWRKEPCEHWAQLKASALFYHWNNQKWGSQSFPWYTAGKELGDIKVARSEGGGERVIKAIHLAMKLDKKFARREEVEEGSVGGIEEEIDEWDDDDFDGWDELV